MTGTTCPNCQTYFAHVEIEYDGDQGYAVLEVAPCQECGAMLCKCCSQFACDGCGHAFCSEHAHLSGNPARPDRFCTTCELEAVAGEVPARCPECQSTEIVCVLYAVAEAETGYREAGERFACRACGASGDASEVLTAPELPAAKPMGVAQSPKRGTLTQTA